MWQTNQPLNVTFQSKMGCFWRKTPIFAFDMSFFSPNTTSPTVCGTTDFSRLLHTVVLANGCTLLLCTEGCAIGSSHFRPVAIRRGTLVPLFTFSRFTIEHSSSRFSCRFIEMDDPSIADFTVNFNSPVFWDFLYQHPVLTL